MIKIPLSDIIGKIKEEAQLSEEEINSKIDDKLKQLSGLISREGAAHIIANELGIKLLDAVSGKLQIKNILAGMRDVETLGRIQQLFEIREFQTEKREGKVGSFILADETGSIRIVCWGSVADKTANLKENDIVKIVSGYVRENQGRKEVHLNEKSKLIPNPPGETVGEIKKYASIRKKIKELQENDNGIELLATIAQVFDIRFFEVCPKCNKRARQREDSFVCEEHSIIEPSYSYVLNVFLDDGTETIRAVFFRNQADTLLGMTAEQILQYKEQPEKFEEIKTKLLGNQIKLVGKTSKNEMFDRLEFIAQRVFLDVNLEEEIKKLKEEAEKMPEPLQQEQKKALPTFEEI